jgi:fucose permease
MASVFPTLYSMAGRRMSISGQVSGFFFVGASLGAMSLPWLVGQLFEVLQPEAMMVCLFVVLALALVLLVIYSRFEGSRVTDE